MVPLQRPDVQTYVDPRGLIVYDPHTGLRVLLGPESTLLWDALAAGSGSPSALMHATPELSDAQRFVRLMQLDQALLLVSPRWRRQEHLFHARAKAVDSPLYVHPFLAHECVKCGSSCQEIHVGPITSLTAAAIRTHSLWRADPEATRPEDILITAEFQKKSVLMLKQVDEHCAVWTHDRGCTIHATSGHKLKPIACQQYPYTMIRTTKGVYVGLQMTCRSLPQSLEAGSGYRPTEIAQRLAPIVMSGGQTNTLPAPAPLSAGIYIPDTALEEWWRWSVQVVEKSLSELELKQAEYTTTETWRATLEELNIYVHEWLIRADEVGESAQWLDPEVWLFQSSLPTRHEVKLSFIDELQHSLLEASMQHQQDQRWQEMKRLERLYEAVEVWSGRWPLPKPRWRGLEADKLLNLSILEGVYSHRLFLQGDLIYGLAHLRLTLELTEALMRLSAHLSSRRAIELSDVNDALVLVNRGLREPVVDNALKRWAGGLRWIMSPEGLPYRHSLGTLEPHLFKLQTHFAKARTSIDSMSVEGATVEAKLSEMRREASERANLQAHDERSEVAHAADISSPVTTSDGEGADVEEVASAAEGESSRALLSELQIQESVIQTVSWVEGVTVHKVVDPQSEASMDDQAELGGGVATPPDPYPDAVDESVPTISPEDQIELGQLSSADESPEPRLKQVPKKSLSAMPQRDRSASAPYDQAAGLRAAKKAKDQKRR